MNLYYHFRIFLIFGKVAVKSDAAAPHGGSRKLDSNPPAVFRLRLLLRSIEGKFTTGTPRTRKGKTGRTSDLRAGHGYILEPKELHHG